MPIIRNLFVCCVYPHRQKIDRVADSAQTSTELFGFGPRLQAKERRLLFHEAVDPTGTTEAQAMNPPHMMTTTTINPLAAERSMASQAVLQDDLCDLTLDELRELPMHMQMGLDLSALD
jgi:hypothetical protein